MTPVKLSSIGIGNTDIEYSFDNPKDVYPQKTAEEIKQYLGYAFFGNEALYKGEISFAFECDGDDYLIERDFGRNTVKLTVNGKKVPENQIDGKINEVVRLTPAQWSEFVLASKLEEYESAKENVQKFTDEIFKELKLTNDISAKSAKEYRKEIESIKNKIEVLNWMNEDDKELEEKMVSMSDEIKAMEVDAARLNEIIGMGNTAKVAIEQKNTVRKLLEEEKARDGQIAKSKEKLERNRAIKEHFAIVKAVIDAKEALKEAETDAANKEEKLAKLNADIKTGKKVIKKKEKEFLDANARVKALNEAFDEMIKANKDDGKGDSYVLEQIVEYCKPGDEKLAELLKTKEELEASKKKTEDAIFKAESDLASVRLNAEYRRAVREGACFEIALEEKKSSLDLLQKALKEDKNTLNGLLEEKVRNESLLYISGEEFAKLFGRSSEKKATLNELIRNYNELERVKQSLYRNQILSATLLQELNAIDKKISENTDMKRSCLENKQALDNAKETLVAYMKKNDKEIAKKEEEFNDLAARKKFYEDIDSLAYGSKCPVCSAPISHKTDGEKAALELVAEQNAVAEELYRLREIKKEHTEKLDSINLRVGSFESTLATCSGYIESLEQTKLAKLAVLKNLYAENHVKGHEELTADLEKTIDEIAKFGAAILDIKAIVSTEETAKIALEGIDARINEIENVLIPAKQERIEELTAEIANYEKGRKDLNKPLKNEKALSLLDDTIQIEAKEDDLYISLNKLYKEKSNVDGKLAEINAEIATLDGRKYTFKIDEKEYSYTALCLNVAAEQYNQVVGEIRAAEKQRQKVQDEYVAITRLVKDKQAEADALQAEADEANKIKEVKKAYIETMKESENGSAAAQAADAKFDKADILSDEEEAKLINEIQEHEEALLKYACEVDALDLIVREAQEAYDGLENNRVASNELNVILQERMDEYVALSNKHNLSKVLKNTIGDLDKAYADVKKRLNDVQAVADGHASDLIVTKTNNALSVLMPKIRVKLKGDGLAVISTSRAGLEKELDKIEDDEYAMVAVSIIAAVKQLVAEVINSSAMMRIIRIRTNLVKEETKAKIKEFAKNNNLIVIFHK